MKYCFAASKQTIVTDSVPALYMELTFLEFLEYICRLAYMMPDKPQLTNDTYFVEKVEYVMDILFQAIRIKRKPRDPFASTSYESESDYD